MHLVKELIQLTPDFRCLGRRVLTCRHLLKKSLLPVLFVLVPCLLHTGSAIAAERRVALVIGNSDYQNAPLANPGNDAADIAALLTNELGFETTLHLDLDQKSMERAIKDFGDAMVGADVRLFYFAGHGVSVEETNYLIPVGAEIQSQQDVRFEAIDSSGVLAKMESSGDGANVIILDACRDNPLPRTRSSGLASRGLATMNAPVGSLILYATAPGSVALDGVGRNGTFTKHLLRGLSASDVHIGDIALDVRVAVMQETENQQVPWSESSLTRRIYLADKSPAVQASLAPQEQAESNNVNASTALSVIENAAPTEDTDDAYGSDILLAYSQAAEQGDAIAQSRLGYMFNVGRSVEQDNAKALYWYQKASSQGNLDAIVNLGVMYRGGDGVATDLAKAYSLFEKAANAGHPSAQYNIGVMHQFGEFVEVGYGVAHTWFQKAVRQGNTDAMVSLGDLFSYGLGLEANDHKAYEWYEKAARYGSAAGQSELGYMYDVGLGVQIDHSKAYNWFEKSAAQGYPRALYNLGEMFELGKGVSTNIDRAVELYRQAADAGDQEGIKAIARLVK